jgi:hypothetical protein
MAMRIILILLATVLAAFWAHDFIQTGAPSMMLAMGLLAVGVAITLLSAIGAFKKKSSGDKGE